MSTLPPVLVDHTITVKPGHTVIDLVFNQEIKGGSGTIIITDGALQTVIDRATGLPATRIVGATDIREISLELVGFNGNTATINADNLKPEHAYRVFILPSVLKSDNLPFAGVSNGNLLTFNSGAPGDTTAATLSTWSLDNTAFWTGKSSAQLSLTFSEAVAQFGSSALAASGLTFGTPASSDGIHWTVAVTAQPGVSLSGTPLSLDMTKVVDLTGNRSFGNPVLSTYSIDTKPPTISSFSLSGDRVSQKGSIDVTVVFSEAVKTLPSSAFTVPNAQLSDTLTTTDGGKTWHGTLSTNANINAVGNVLKLNMGMVEDLAGNHGSGLTQADKTYDVDVTAPTATLTLSDTHLTSTHGATLTIVFSEAVTTPSLSWFTTPHAVLSNLANPSNDGKTWTATLTPTGTGTSTGNQVALDMSHVTDLAGNTSTGSVTSLSYDTDSTASTGLPTVTGIIMSGDSGYTAYNPERATDFVTNISYMGLEGSLSAALTGSQTVELTIGTHQVTAHVSGTHWYYQPTVAPSWFVDDTYTVTARVVDGASSGTAFTKPLVLDTKAPHITSATQNFTQDVNQALVITFDEPVSWHGIVDPESDYEQWHDADNFVKLVHNGLTEWVYIDNRNLSNGGRTLTISANDLHLASGKDYTLELRQSGADYVSLTDTAGNYIDYNKFTFTTTGTSSDTVAPKALAAYAMQTGTFGIGEQIEIKVKFSEPVTGGAVWPELNLSNGGKATFQFPSNDGRTMDFRYTVAAGDATGYLDLDGLGTMLENVIDIAGNKLAPGSLHLSTLLDPGLGSMVFIDTTLPTTIATAPVLDDLADTGVKGDSVTNTNYPSFHGVGATPGTTVVLYDVSWDGQEAIGYTAAMSDGSWNISLNRELQLPLVDGEHHLAVGQLSTYGNPSHALSPELTLIIDRTADAIEPEIDVDSDGGVIRDWKTAVTSPTLLLRYVEAGATVTILDGATPLTVTSTIDSTGLWHVKLPTLTNGVHSLKITQTDAAGNTSTVVSRDLTIDPAEVLVPVPQPPAKLALPRLDTDTGLSGTDGITSASQPVFKGSGALPHATIQLTDGKFILLSGEADGDGAWTLSPSTALSDGAYMFTVRQIDSGSLIGPSSDPLSVTIDTAAPSKLDAPILKAADDSGSSPSDLITNVTKPGFSGTGEAGATVELWDGSTKLVSKTVDSSGTWSLSPATALAEGVHSLTLKQVDAAGNASTSDATSITIDTTAPAKLNAPLLAASSDSGSSSSDLLTNVKMPEFKGTGAVANATMELREGNNVLATGTARSDGTWSLTVSEGKALADGVHAISVLQFDAAGNSSTSDATSITIDTLAPTVTGWTPTVKLGHNFELWFSERVDHSALSSYADVSISPSLFHYSLADSAYWIDNAVRDDHTTSVFGFTPANTGWLQLTLSGVKDLAGNEAVIPLAHYEFTVDLSGTSFFVPSPLL